MEDTPSYKDILNRLREICIVKSLKEGMLAGHFCRLLSPYCSAFFIKRGYSPNKVTVFMILFGIIGSIFFALPYGWAKIVGYIFWYLWFTMDLSDGEVARYTHKFSKYGVEMDYMAHLIDHPLMNIALWLTFLEFNLINTNLLALIFIVSISVELVLRNITAFQYYKGYSGTSQELQSTRQNASILKYLLMQATLYPNFIILFTPIIIFDWFIKSGIALYFYIGWMVYCALIFIRTIYKTVAIFYKN